MSPDAHVPAKVLDMLQDPANPMLPGERYAVHKALQAGANYGYGNLIAWLATAWAVDLRDDYDLPEEVAIDAVSNRGPYPLPK